LTEHHPLTDEIILELIGDNLFLCLTEDDMRVAADWQLEQVMEWGYKYLYPDQVNALREAMRPQQKEHDATPWLEITYDAFKLTSDPE
jgi:hypothetical protein